MSIANFPFPSFTLLLTSDRVVIPGPSYVFRLAPLEEITFMPRVNRNVTGYSEEDNPPNCSLENDYGTNDAFSHSESDTLTYETETAVTGDEDEPEFGINKPLPFLKMRRSARFRLGNIYRRLSQLSM